MATPGERIVQARCTNDSVVFELADGRTISAPLAWYPRLLQATAGNPERPAAYAVELRTARWAELVAWYRDALGLRVLVRAVEDGYALLAAGDVRLAILARPQAPGPSDRWSLAFEVGDLEAVWARLAATTAAPSEPRTHAEGYREFTVNDPDGNRLRLFSWPVAGA